MDMETFPKTLHEVISHFDADTAHDFFVSLRWPDGVRCPRCQSDRVSFISTRKVWTCMNCTSLKQFSVKAGTIFEGSPIKLDKWFAAMWLLTNAKNGISSYEIHRAIGVTQKTAWFMMHRIRVAMQTGSFVKDQLQGTVEVDESYIGGKARNMHRHTKERRGITGTGGTGKTAVMGLLERHGPKQKVSRVIAQVVQTTKKHELLGKVRQYVLKGAEIHTDALQSYNDLSKLGEFEHKVVDHAECYVKNGVHTNGLENFWSLLKRGIKGTYVSVEPFHLFRYLSEQVFRFNERKDNDQGRFLNVLGNVMGKRLRYRKLIGDNYGLPTTA